jgi:hypothetical protein
MIKTITTPDSWSEVNISQFQELSVTEDIFEKIAILTDEDPEELKLMDVASFGRLTAALSWVHILPNEDARKDVIVIDEIEYGFIDKLSSLSLGEWIDIENYLKDPIKNLHKLMAMFYRPLLTTLKDGTRITEDYDITQASNNANTFLTKMNVSDCYGSLVFFSLIANDCLKTIQAYFQVEILKNQLMKMNQKENKD